MSHSVPAGGVASERKVKRRCTDHGGNWMCTTEENSSSKWLVAQVVMGVNVF